MLIEKGLIRSLNSLFEHTFESSKVNGFLLEELDSVVLVGGGSRIPLIKKWLKEKCNPTQLLTPPSIEAVAIGALNLTPGVKVRDVLQKGISLRYWDQKTKTYLWHPLFLAGQPWPTSKPLEIILAASKNNQIEIELQTGEPDFNNANEIIYINGMPTIKAGEVTPQIKESINSKINIQLSKPAQPGDDCLKLNFSINNDCNIIVEGIDLLNGETISTRNLGSVR